MEWPSLPNTERLRGSRRSLGRMVLDGGRRTLDCPDPACDWWVSVADPLYPELREEHLAVSALLAHVEAEHPEMLDLHL